MRDYAQFSFVWSLLYPLIIALCSYHLSQNEGIPEQKMTFQITLFLMLPFGDWSLLEEGEEDKKDTSKNPHLGELGRECYTIRSQNTGIAWMGRGDMTPAWIFLKDFSTCTEGPQRWSFITKKWYFPTKVFPRIDHSTKSI